MAKKELIMGKYYKMKTLRRHKRFSKLPACITQDYVLTHRKLVNCRVTPRDHEALTEFASKHHMTLSDFLRLSIEAGVKEVKRRGKSQKYLGKTMDEEPFLSFQYAPDCIEAVYSKNR
jgi:hypothetical protein